MEKKKNKKATVIIISIFIVLILAILISYAYFTTELNGSDQVVKVGTLDLVLDETSEGIILEEAVGISDSKGMSLDGSTFELRNNGNKTVEYTIYLDDNTISDTDTRIDDKYLKYNLNKNGEDSGPTSLTSIGSNPNRVLDTGTIDGGVTNKYSLKLWITSDVDGNYSGQVFSGKLRVEVSQVRPGAGETILDNLSSGDTYDDGTDTFITGEDPNNYVWYSGKLWRAVSVNNEAKTTKLVTQWNISAINYSSSSTAFAGSYMEEWLNDTTVDGFLGNLREPEKFIVMDAVWDATEDSNLLGNITRPNKKTLVTDAVGLLNIYEYQSSSGKNPSAYNTSYLSNDLYWFTLTPYDLNDSGILSIDNHGDLFSARPLGNLYGVRPSINLKSNVKIVDGNGTVNNPYRLNGDNDTNLSGTLLSSRYSGEYIRFGSNENNLYRIVSHENGTGTKIVSAEPLKNSGVFITSAFGSNATFSSTNIIGTFLNGEYLTSYVDSTYSDMIEESSTWYLGKVEKNENYKLAKYIDTSMSEYVKNINAKVGLLRYGELMAGHFDKNSNNLTYWILTSGDLYNIYSINNYGVAALISPSNFSYGIKASLNLKQNVVITGGDGTKNNPFTVTLGS